MADLTSYTFMERTCNLQHHTKCDEHHEPRRTQSERWLVYSVKLGMTNVNVYRHRSCTSARAYWRSPWTCMWGNSRASETGEGKLELEGCWVLLEGVGWRV